MDLSGQSTTSTLVTDICEGEGLINRNTPDLDTDFLCGTSESEDL